MHIYARTLAMVGRAARARRVPEPNAPAPAWARYLTKRLERYADDAGLPHDLSLEISELEGYLTGLRLTREHDIGNAGFALARSAVMRLHRDTDRSRSPFLHDKPLAKVYEMLGRLYLCFGSWKPAADCYARASLLWWDKRNTQRTFSMLILCRLLDGDSATAAELLDDLGPATGPQQHFQRIARALADPWADPRAEVSRFPLTRPLGPAPHGYLASATAGRLADEGHLDEALDLLDTTTAYLEGVRADGWVLADLRQRKAGVLLAMGRHEECRELALAAWAFLGSSRYQACSHAQRQATWRYFAPSRHAALQASIALGDSGSVGELIENCRRQSVIAAEVGVEVGGAGLDAMLAVAGEDPARCGPRGPRADSSLFTPINDAFNATRLLMPKPVPPGAMAFPEGAFWATHVENGMLFWFLAVDGAHVGHGVSDLRDHEDLRPVLRTGRPGAPDYEPVRHLADWRSPEEQAISTAIGAVLPEPLVELLVRATRDAPLRLTIAAAPELAAVLWPIAVVPGTEDRLIERAVLRMWTSGAVESERSARPEPPLGRATPFLLAWDTPDGSPHPRPDPSTAGRPRVWLQGAAATRTALTEALRDIGPGTSGLFLHTGHAQSWPALSLAEDGELRAGELLDTADDGAPVLPMPSRVILSRCSHTGDAALGDETIGLAAGIIQSGAHHVIATGVDAFDSSFTRTFDDILVKGMLAPDADAGVLLRATQLRMLTEWKVHSLRGGADPAGDVNGPHPVIWAAYQAF
ncbi:CHAT domain-containing protein [Umezawaea sp. Da 62-37]|uniref:CHAT domain-containing protein n=1 Tax=Umezawaea sp. Da 62-37 TaxID=3075927 RepID=UPI0028F6F32B|nr:CHAT domain-containing protein [Umezawaea sp. Da 62-37]WNV84533.1 CHAT domain-containing protein [Umezawaea sp. Da 62-37]